MTQRSENLGADRFDRKHRRRLWLQVNLYLGLSAGAVLAVVGVTGEHSGLLAGIGRAVAPELRRVDPAHGSTEYRPLDDLVAAAQGRFRRMANLMHWRFQTMRIQGSLSLRGRV